MDVSPLRRECRPAAAAGNRLRQVIRRNAPQCLVNIGEMLAVKFVKVAIIRRMMFRPVPPVPVAALGNQDFFKRQCALFFGRAGRGLRAKISRVMQVVPRTIIFRRSNPDVEVRVDPRPRHQRLQRSWGLVALNRLRHGHGFNSWVFLQSIIESPQELPSRLRIVFPGILAIQNNGHDGIYAIRQHRLRRIFNFLDETIGRVLRRHTGIDESNQVGESVVAEQHVHPRVVFLVLINRVQLMRQVGIQPAIAVAREIRAERPAQYTFVGGHPLNSEFVRDGEHFLRNAAFRWPNALGPHAKYALVEIEPAPQLFASIVRMAIAVLRQRQPRR